MLRPFTPEDGSGNSWFPWIILSRFRLEIIVHKLWMMILSGVMELGILFTKGKVEKAIG